MENVVLGSISLLKRNEVVGRIVADAIIVHSYSKEADSLTRLLELLRTFRILVFARLLHLLRLQNLFILFL